MSGCHRSTTGERKSEGNLRPAAGALLGPDRAALGFDEPAGDREAEAGAAVCLPGGVVSPEAVEHPACGLRREAVARVLDA